MNITDWLRKTFRGILECIAEFLNRLGVMPNTMTFLGLIGNIIAAYCISMDKMVSGGVIVLIMGPIDALDGTMARLRGEPTNYGAFVDSVTDRYSEIVILGGLMIYFLNSNNTNACFLVYAAAIGSVLISYVRARAESLDFEAKAGLLTRVERYMVIVPSLLLKKPVIGLWIIAVLGNITAFQRIWCVRQQARRTFKKKNRKTK
ncbi:MAG TPA: CDP-alcohol phosphatidyltransferase family protein [Anaerolineae bacterium]|nr:CDP-alcohol phosphatidyltransferase family protein [Anaerolineae bacterium]